MAFFIFIGMLIRDIQYKKYNTFGVIEVNYSNPNKDTLTLRIEDLSDLEDKKGVYCRIVRTK